MPCGTFLLVGTRATSANVCASKMLMLYEDTKATLRTMAEQYREVPGQLRELKEQMTGVTAQLTILIDSNRHFARVPDYHEHRITDLENRPGR